MNTARRSMVCARYIAITDCWWTSPSARRLAAVVHVRLEREPADGLTPRAVAVDADVVGVRRNIELRAGDRDDIGGELGLIALRIELEPELHVRRGLFADRMQVQIEVDL